MEAFLSLFCNCLLKTLEFPHVTLQEKKMPLHFLNDEVDVGLHFFHKFLDVYMVQNTVIRLNKYLFCEAYLIKVFTFDPHIAYQSFKPTTELPLTSKEILFFVENLKLIKKSYDNESKTLSIPYSTPKFVKSPQQTLYSCISKDLQTDNQV